MPRQRPVELPAIPAQRIAPLFDAVGVVKQAVENAVGPRRVIDLFVSGQGETDALTLAAKLHTDLVLMDDRHAVAVAHEMGMTVTEEMGLLVVRAALPAGN